MFIITVTEKNIFSSKSLFPYLISEKRSRSRSRHVVTQKILAKKSDLSESQSAANKLPNSYKNLIQSTAVGVFALGFIDAGYSGDWSRIGVISTETEDLLKAAAFLLVPLCLYFIFSMSYNKAGE